MTIIFATSEVVPFSKTGGLADVAGALPSALARSGHQVILITPRYRSVDPKEHKLSPVGGGPLSVHLAGNEHRVNLLERRLDGGVRAIFLDYPPFFDREQLYGTSAGDYHDNALRFGLFSKVVAHLITNNPEPVDLVHLNEWQTGIVPLFLSQNPAARPKILFTIHNIGYQGLFPADVLPALGLGWEMFTMDGLEFYGKVSFLKAGIVYSDWVSTVSPTYAKEIQTPEFGYGLDGVLRERKDRLTGIINGVDYDVWSPEKDPHLATQYDVSEWTQKRICKADLQKRVGLPALPHVPLVGMVSRLAAQKGFDLLDEVMDELLERNLQLVVLGSGEHRYESRLAQMASDERYKDKLAVVLAFNNVLAHKIEGGADMFLMPSRYEPCGLNQLYSLRYGTVPVVRATGGLEDTVEEFDPQNMQGTGFKFIEYDAQSMLKSLDKALRTYRSRDKKLWSSLVRNGMTRDYSWGASAKQYEALYEKMVANT